MKVSNADKVIFLLSTDWFFEYWAAIGLNGESSAKQYLKKSCQDITRHIMKDVSEYWLVSFAEDRIEAVKSKFLCAVEKSGFEKAFLDKIQSLLENPSGVFVESDTSWLLVALTDLLASGSQVDEANEIDIVLQQKIADQWRLCNPEEINFSEICLSSVSDWDIYVRSITPDLPAMLADYVEIEIAGKDRLAFFWDRICKTLTPMEKCNLLAWYTSAARILAEQELVPPKWME